MKTQLVLRHLMHHRGRTAVAVAGVAFAVVLVFMQLGFLGAVSNTATMIYDAMEFDLVLRSPAYLHLSEARTFPRIRLDQAASLSEVAAAGPFYVCLNEWQSPTTGEWRGILTMGINPHDPVFRVPEIRDQANRLVEPQFLLIDQMSRSDYGPANRDCFGDQDIEVETNLGQQRVQIVGHFNLGTGLAANGAVVLSTEGFARVAKGQTIEEINLGLIRMAPGATLQETKRALQQAFADLSDVEVLTRDELLTAEKRRWIQETSLGTIFQIGVLVSLFVGTAIVYQVLSTDIANMMGEYATLKAMGYTDGYLARVVVQQSTILSIVGFVPGLIAATLLYAMTGAVAGIPMKMTLDRMVGVLVLSLLMCTASGFAALRKTRQADPADLF